VVELGAARVAATLHLTSKHRTRRCAGFCHPPPHIKTWNSALRGFLPPSTLHKNIELGAARVAAALYLTYTHIAMDHIPIKTLNVGFS
jgi:hypothetical protein